jgi:nucleoside-diphosphate-sugar epimerase
VDLTNSTAIGNLFEHADDVYHLADVVAGIGFVFEHEAWLFRQNILINTNVFEAVQRAGTVKNYIYVGTACSFPLELQSSYHVVALHENQTYPAHPESAYGWSKLMGEYEGTLALKNSHRKLNVGLLRLHNVYGPHAEYADKTSSQALPALIRKAIHAPLSEMFEIWGSGKQYRDFLYVDDVVSALLDMRQRGMNHGVIQVGTGVATTILDAAEIIRTLTEECLGKSIDLTVNKSKHEGDMGRIATLDRAKSILQWEARVTLHEGLARTYKWILSDMRKRHALERDSLAAKLTIQDAIECLDRSSKRSTKGSVPTPVDATVGQMRKSGKVGGSEKRLGPSPDAVVVSKQSDPAPAPHPAGNHKEVRIVWESCGAKRNAYHYYTDWVDAVKHHPSVLPCSAEDVKAFRCVWFLQAECTTYVETFSATLKRIKPKVLEAAKTKRKLVMAVFLNKVYSRLEEKLGLLSELASWHNDLYIQVFSWSPVVGSYPTKGRISYHFVPMAVDKNVLPKPDQASKTRIVHDLFFRGDDNPEKYPLRRALVADFPNISKGHGIQIYHPPGFLSTPNYYAALLSSRLILATGLLQWFLTGTRYYEVMGSGGGALFCYREPQVNDPLGIIEDKHAIMFGSKEEFIEKLLQYSNKTGSAEAEMKRREIVRNARELTLSRHLWPYRAADIHAVLSKLT